MKYYSEDYWGMSEEDLKQDFPGAVQRLIEELPAGLGVQDVTFGVDHHFQRGDYDDPGYYLAWVIGREENAKEENTY